MAETPATFSGIWEYQAVQITDLGGGLGVSQKLNELGKQGWEVISLARESGITGYVAFMKHKRQ